MTATEVAQKWQDLQAHIRRWYSEPDLHALEIAFCVYISHLFLTEDPVWLFVIGPPGTGKTGIVGSCLSALPKVHVISDLTATTFISGFGKGNKDYGLLNRIAPASDPQSVLVFKDFTSFLSRREDTRKEIASQLREIHDGYYSREVGTSRKTLAWRGKLTVIAACTPALERCWAVLRELGDRFLAVRWPRGDGIAMGIKAANQISREREIRDEMHRLSLAFMDPTARGMSAVTAPGADLIHRAAAIAEVSAILRTTIIRQSSGYHEISHVASPEGTSRLVKGMCQLARARAVLFRRSGVTEEDLKSVRRAVIDAIPLIRLKIFESIPSQAPIRQIDIREISKLPESTLSIELDELEALNVIRDAGTAAHGAKSYCFTDEFEAIRVIAFP